MCEYKIARGKTNWYYLSKNTDVVGDRVGGLENTEMSAIVWGITGWTITMMRIGSGVWHIKYGKQGLCMDGHREKD